jgi:hypothetical protein
VNHVVEWGLTQYPKSSLKKQKKWQSQYVCSKLAVTVAMYRTSSYSTKTSFMSLSNLFPISARCDICLPKSSHALKRRIRSAVVKETTSTGCSKNSMLPAQATSMIQHIVHFPTKQTKIKTKIRAPNLKFQARDHTH